MPYFHTWCGLSANLGRRSETFRRRLAENTQRKKSPKISDLRTIAQLWRAISSQPRHVSTIGRKLLNANISPTGPHLIDVNFGSLAAEIGSLVWGHPSKFQRVSLLGFVTVATSLNRSQPNFAGCLAVSWAGRLYIHFRGLLPRNGILPGAKFTLRPSLALSCIASVTARYSSSWRQPYFATLSRGRHLCSAGRPSRWALAHILVER